MLFYDSLCHMLFEAWDGLLKILWGASEKIEKKEIGREGRKLR